MCRWYLKKATTGTWSWIKRQKPVYKPGFVRRPSGRRDGHFSRKSIARFLQQSTRKSMAGRTDPLETSAATLQWPHAPCLTLLPVGFTEPSRLPSLLVSSYLTVSPLPRGPSPRGGLLSVALSLALRPVGVTHHCVLWSPDFPPAAFAAGDCPIDFRRIKHRLRGASGQGAQCNSRNSALVR